MALFPIPYSLFRRNFSHGVHPNEHKSLTDELPTRRMPFVGRYVLPLNQHLGAPAKPVVTPGQRVRRGERIAEPGAFVSTSLHSPVTGTIREIGDFRGADGRFAPAGADEHVAVSTDVGHPPALTDDEQHVVPAVQRHVRPGQRVARRQLEARGLGIAPTP